MADLQNQLLIFSSLKHYGFNRPLILNHGCYTQKQVSVKDHLQGRKIRYGPVKYQGSGREPGSFTFWGHSCLWPQNVKKDRYVSKKTYCWQFTPNFGLVLLSWRVRPRVFLPCKPPFSHLYLVNVGELKQSKNDGHGNQNKQNKQKPISLYRSA